MITAVILALLGVLLLIVVRQMFKAPGGPQLPGGKTAAPLPAPPPSAVAGTGDIATDLWSAKPGDVISISAAAADFSDLDFTVDRRSAYEGANRRWIDLSGEHRGNRVYLEVYRTPDFEVMGMLDPRKLTLNDLSVSEDRMADLDAKQDPTQYVEFEGKRWHYESSREIGYFENEQGQGEGLYRWIFRNPNGPELLCVEKWEGEPFDVRVARRINPQDIAVYRAA
ncbi:MAG: DUF4178 domain-containing protein [Bryobacteraceae bacterium]|nr:DUF4178 domain-containing protein [Bryobacteraceae bacterium]